MRSHIPALTLLLRVSQFLPKYRRLFFSTSLYVSALARLLGGKAVVLDIVHCPLDARVAYGLSAAPVFDRDSVNEDTCFSGMLVQHC